jgi:hypothetical protein
MGREELERAIVMRLEGRSVRAIAVDDANAEGNDRQGARHGVSKREVTRGPPILGHRRERKRGTHLEIFALGLCPQQITWPPLVTADQCSAK